VTTNALCSHSFTDVTATNVWVDFYTRVPLAGTGSAPAVTNGAAYFYVDSDGKVRAISNNTWVVFDNVVPADTWQRFSVHLDYVTETWELHLAGATPGELATPVATNLAFAANSTNTYFKGFRIQYN
jgi:hypothetical protein